MKYTELMVSLLSGDLTVEALVNMSPQDFLSEEEKNKREQQEQ